jgi:hypothetical protein
MLPSTLLSGLALVGAVWAIVGQDAYGRENVGTAAARTGVPDMLSIDRKRADRIVSEPPPADPRSDPLSLVYDPRFDPDSLRYDPGVADPRSPNYQPISEYEGERQRRERVRELTGFVIQIVDIGKIDYVIKDKILTLSLTNNRDPASFPSMELRAQIIDKKEYLMLGSLEFDAGIEKLNRESSGQNQRTVAVPVTKFHEDESHLEAIRAWLQKRDPEDASMEFKNKNPALKTMYITRHDPVAGLDAPALQGALGPDGTLTEAALPAFDNWYAGKDISSRVPRAALSPEALRVLVAQWISFWSLNGTRYAAIGGDPLPAAETVPAVETLMKSISRVYASSFNDMKNPSRIFPFSTQVKVSATDDDIDPNEDKQKLYSIIALVKRKYYADLFSPSQGTQPPEIENDKVVPLSKNIEYLLRLRERQHELNKRLGSQNESAVSVAPFYAVGKNHGIYLIGKYLQAKHESVITINTPTPVPYFHEQMRILARLGRDNNVYWVDRLLSVSAQNPIVKTMIGMVSEALSITKWTAISMMCMAKEGYNYIEALTFADVVEQFKIPKRDEQDSKPRAVSAAPNANYREFLDDPIAIAVQGNNVVVSISQKAVGGDGGKYWGDIKNVILPHYLTEGKKSIKILFVKTDEITDWPLPNEDRTKQLDKKIEVVVALQSDIETYMDMEHYSFQASNTISNALNLLTYAYKYYPPIKDEGGIEVLTPLCVSFINMINMIEEKSTTTTTVLTIQQPGDTKLDTWVAKIDNDKREALAGVLKIAEFEDENQNKYYRATDEVVLRSSYGVVYKGVPGKCVYTELSNMDATGILQSVRVHFFSSERMVKVKDYEEEWKGWSLLHVAKVFRDIDSVLSHQLMERVAGDPESKVVYRVDVDMKRDSGGRQPFGNGLVSMLIMNKVVVLGVNNPPPHAVPYVLETPPGWSPLDLRVTDVILKNGDLTQRPSYRITVDDAEKGSVFMADKNRVFDGVEIRLNYESQWYVDGCEYAFVRRAKTPPTATESGITYLKSSTPTVEDVITQLKSGFDEAVDLKQESDTPYNPETARPYLEGPIASELRRRVVARRGEDSYLLYWKHPDTLYWSPLFATPVNKMFRDLRIDPNTSKIDFDRGNDIDKGFRQYLGDATVYGSAQADVAALYTFLDPNTPPQRTTGTTRS